MLDRDEQFERVEMPIRARSQRVSLLIMIAVSCALLLLGRAEAYVFDQARDKVSEATAPVLEILSTPIAIVRDWIEGVQGFFDVYAENQRLKDENARLLEWKATALRMEQTASRYQALLDVQLEPTIGYVTGRVIADSGGPFVHTYIVNAGRKHGVQVGQGVIDTEGLIGRIVGVGNSASRVLIVNDLNSRVPVLIEPGHYRAIMVGDNSSTPRLEFLPDEVDIEQGDRVITSGHGGLLPPGLPVGEVVIEKEGTYFVKPYGDQARVDFVRILSYEFPREIEVEEDLLSESRNTPVTPKRNVAQNGE